MIENDNKQDELVDLSDALKDSNKEIEIQNKQQQSAQIFFPGTPKIIQWTIKYSGGLIKNEKQAQYVLLGFIAVIIIVSLFLVFSGEDKETEATPDPTIYR